MYLKSELTEIEDLIEKSDKLNTTVSAKGIDWHIDHSLKVIIGVSNMLKNSDISAYKWKFNFTRLFVYTFKYFPRGKGKAPKSVLPPEIILKEDLYTQLELAKQQLSSIIDLPSKSNFKHPYFGILNLKETQQFLKLHTQHHLKICRDIIK